VNWNCEFYSACVRCSAFLLSTQVHVENGNLHSGLASLFCRLLYLDGDFKLDICKSRRLSELFKSYLPLEALWVDDCLGVLQFSLCVLDASYNGYQNRSDEFL